jgi:uncharacterized protein (TIGR04255 family)
MGMSALPEKLRNPPLVEAVLELRFHPSQPAAGDLLPGLLFAELKGEFAQIEQLPFGNISRLVRMSVPPELQYQAHVKLVSQAATILIGDRSVTITQSPPYAGWTAFRSLGERVLDVAKKTGLIATVERYSFKCINVIEPKGRHPFDILRGEFHLGNQKILRDGLHMRFHVEHPKLLNIIEVAGEATATWRGGARTGALVSVDTISAADNKTFWSDLRANLDQAHLVLKGIFFGIVRQEIIEEWEPISDPGRPGQ